jgi:hypothetical protein
MAAKIRGKEFDGDAWIEVADGADDGNQFRGTLQRKVVASNHGDDDVSKAEIFDRVGDAERFVGFRGFGLFRKIDVAKGAVTGALFAKGKKGGGLFRVTFEAIRAFGFFANGVEVVFAKDGVGAENLISGRDVSVEPGGETT